MEWIVCFNLDRPKYFEEKRFSSPYFAGERCLDRRGTPSLKSRTRNADERTGHRSSAPIRKARSMIPGLETVFERKVREALSQTFDEADGWFDKDEGLRCYKPGVDDWSIDEVFEHLSRMNRFLLDHIVESRSKTIQRFRDAETLPTTETDLERLESISVRGTTRWVCPEITTPTGEPTIEEIRKKLRQQGEECQAILHSLLGGLGALAKITLSVYEESSLNLYEWLYFLCQHIRRHLAQMAENEHLYLESLSNA